MTFGWFVPLASLYVLWTKRAALAIAVRTGRFSWAGLAASLPFLVLALLGTRGVQLRLEQLGFIGLCVTLPWTFFGWRCARLFLFPAAYLLFCIPLATFLDFVTIHLRYLASSTAMTVLNGFGLAAVREGTAVISRGAHPFAVDVAEPCSGLRSLFPLMALTAGYAYFNQPTLLRRGLLFVCSIPLAVAGNVARIVSICVIASFSDPKFATGFYHDYSGYIVFIVAILLMMMVNRLIDSVFVARTVPVKRESADAGQPECVAVQPRGVLLPIAATAFFVAVFVWYYIKEKHKTWLLTISVGLLMAGCLGNMIDRIFLGYVRDFILGTPEDFGSRAECSAEGYGYLQEDVCGDIWRTFSCGVHCWRHLPCLYPSS